MTVEAYHKLIVSYEPPPYVSFQLMRYSSVIEALSHCGATPLMFMLQWGLERCYAADNQELHDGILDAIQRAMISLHGPEFSTMIGTMPMKSSADDMQLAKESGWNYCDKDAVWFAKLEEIYAHRIRGSFSAQLLNDIAACISQHPKLPAPVMMSCASCGRKLGLKPRHQCQDCGNGCCGICLTDGSCSRCFTCRVPGRKS